MQKRNELIKALFAILILRFSFPLYFYNLGQSSLSNWDEAWYGDIARNITKNADFFRLMWNGKPYIDHPPVGFWIIASFFKAFGVNEFVDRLPSAIFGIGGVLLTYFIGKKLFSARVAFCSAFSLGSCFWYMARSRTGNLDIFLSFFFLLSFYLFLKLSDNKKYFIPATLSLSALFLTKSLVPFVLIPVIFLFLSKSNRKIILLSLSISIFFFLLWVLIQTYFDHKFLTHYFAIGLPGAKLKSNYYANLTLYREYLHNGIGKWFWPSIFSIIISPFFMQRRFLSLSLFFIIFSIPFIFSNKGHIWHLIPLYPFMLLCFFGFYDCILQQFIKLKFVARVCLFLVAFYFSILQFRQMWYEFINIPAYISDEAILSKEAKKYPGNLYLDGSDFMPEVVFYSEKEVTWIPENSLDKLFSKEDSFMILTYQWRLDKFQISKGKYRIIKTDRDKILVQSI